MAKSPDDRYPTCGALIAAAEEALGLRQRPMLALAPPARGRRRAVAVVGAARSWPLSSPETTDDAVRPDCPREHARPHRPGDEHRQGGGRRRPGPLATAVAGRSVWVYNRPTHDLGDRRYDERGPADDAGLGHPVDHGLLAGPVLAADTDGAWIVGVDGRGRPLLTRVLSGAAKREYRLDHEPRAVVVARARCGSSGAGTRDNQVLRIDPATGDVTGRTRFPLRRGSRVSTSAWARLGRVLVQRRSTGSTLARPP